MEKRKVFQIAGNDKKIGRKTVQGTEPVTQPLLGG